MARLESGNLNLKLGWNSIADLIHSVTERLKNESKFHKLNIKIDEDIVFRFDYTLLEQAIINIVHNAIAYTPVGK